MMEKYPTQAQKTALPRSVVDTSQSRETSRAQTTCKCARLWPTLVCVAKYPLAHFQSLFSDGLAGNCVPPGEQNVADYLEYILLNGHCRYLI